MKKEYEACMRRRQLQDMIFSLVAMSKMFDYGVVATIVDDLLIKPMDAVVKSLKKKHEEKGDKELDTEDKLYLKSQIGKMRLKIEEEVLGKDPVRKREKKPGNEVKSLELADDNVLKMNQPRKEL